MKKTWTIGTRGSRLALKQTETVIDHLRGVYPDYRFTVTIIKTTGDTIWDRPLHLVGGKGIFVKEIEDALLSGDIDLAVHSVKDLPTALMNGLVLGAVLEREDPRDVFLSNTFDTLSDIPDGGRIGTSSLRRKSQLLYHNNTLQIVPLRGNVDTRIKKIGSQNLDGIILACAGVKRMGFEGAIRQIVPLDIMVPPSGQGAIGIESRDTGESLELLYPINHMKSFREITLERSLQLMIGGGCQVPLGINASLGEDGYTLSVVLGEENGNILFKKQIELKEENIDDELFILAELVKKAGPIP